MPLRSPLVALALLVRVVCSSSCDETLSETGAGYRGCQNMTRSGKSCQRWDSQSPHDHSGTTPSANPDAGLESNYCRNPDDEDTIWCYTTDPNTRWEYCTPMPVPLTCARDTGLACQFGFCPTDQKCVGNSLWNPGTCHCTDSCFKNGTCSLDKYCAWPSASSIGACDSISRAQCRCCCQRPPSPEPWLAGHFASSTSLQVVMRYSLGGANSLDGTAVYSTNGLPVVVVTHGTAMVLNGMA